MKEFDIRIGLEIHVQLNTKTKMFCSCPNRLEDEPNTNICPICTGQPGILPQPNEEAIFKGILVSRALNSKIPEVLYFSRKNYFYPDLPKGYQITQYGISIGEKGILKVLTPEGIKEYPLERINLEEETAKSYHEGKKVYLDFNRCGIPLLEIVTPPFFTSPKEVGLFLKSLRRVLIYLSVSNCDMEKGEFRVDTNVSVNFKGEKKEHRTELKNLNSLTALKEAISFEIERQRKLLMEGKEVERETRLWDEEKKETRVMRTKEFVEDYRYFPEPDIPPFEIEEKWLLEKLSLLPDYYFDKFIKKGASFKESEILISSPFLAKFCENIFERFPYEKVKGWILTEILQYIDDLESLNSLPFSQEEFVDFLDKITKGEIPRHVGQEMIKKVMVENIPLKELLKSKIEIKKGEEIEGFIRDVIFENEEVVKKIKSGKKSAISFLVGEVMRKVKGKANPKEVKEKIEKALGI